MPTIVTVGGVKTSIECETNSAVDSTGSNQEISSDIPKTINGAGELGDVNAIIRHFNLDPKRASVVLRLLSDTPESRFHWFRMDGRLIDGLLEPIIVTANSDIRIANFQTSSSTFLVVSKSARPHTASENDKAKRVKECSSIKEFIIGLILDHKGILSAFGIMKDKANPSNLVIISKYQKNGTLFSYLQDHLQVNQISLLMEVADGLCYMHSLTCPVLHGDVKSHNIVIDDDGRPLLTDFGSAAIRDPITLRFPYRLGGTPRWMACEAYVPSLFPATLFIDSYAFASTAIEVFTRKRPFNNIDPDAAVIVKVVVDKEHPLRPEGMEAGELTDDLWKMLVKCWEFNPSDRPSMQEIRDLLRGMLLSID
ncbi:kinase-like domain-containing protein [Crucibulum laeve]|uniref:Kinase-like domain-containing protein n=1 Tax=Crucibulum laeve TaxID=68775 RepID=A0A5C3LH80_9AGAR|nr:kinase-like domain-containing protein [Crucibulum laeve]